MMYFFKKNAKNVRVSNKYRLLKYIKQSVSQGGVLGINDLINRFLKITAQSISDQTKSSWKKWLRENAKKNDLYIFKSTDEAFKIVEKVIHHREEKAKVYAPRKNVFADSIKKALKNRKVEAVSVYGVLENNGFNPRSLERHIKTLKQNAFMFGLEFFQKGRILMAKTKSNVIPFQKDFSSKNTPQVLEAPIIDKKLKRKERNRNTGKPAFRINKKLSRKAHWLTKELKPLFYDNCKVEFHYGTCFNFVGWALGEGFKDKEIKYRFQQALETRHGDATDFGINTQNYTFKFKASSTVSLAKELLLKNSKENRDQRVQNVISFIKNRVFEKTTVSHSKQSLVEEAPIPQDTVASFEDFAVSFGFNRNQVSSFSSFESASPFIQKQFLAHSPTLANLFSRLANLKLHFNQISA